MQNISNHIFALVGHSGSGKTTLQYSVRNVLSVPTGVTSRPHRSGDIDGQYIYTTIEGIIKLASEDKLVLLNHVYANTVYAYLRDEVESDNSIIVVDLVGLRQLQERYGFNNVTGIYVETGDDIRHARTMIRGHSDSASRKLIDDVKFRNVYHLTDYKITNDGHIKDAISELKSIIFEVLSEKKSQNKE